MIVAKLEQLFGQIPAQAAIKQGLDYILANRDKNLADGRYEIAGEALYGLVQSYDTLPVTPDAKFEAHRNYIDIQYIATGQEVMGWAAVEQMVVKNPYQTEKDVCTGICPPEATTLVLVDAGQAAIFFPEDAHAPKLANGAPGWVKKIVVKVRVE